MSRLVVAFALLLVLSTPHAEARRPRRGATRLVRLVPHSVLEEREYEGDATKPSLRAKPSLARWLDGLDGKYDGVLRRTNLGENVTVYVVDSGCDGDESISFIRGDKHPRYDGARHGSRVAKIVRTLVPSARLVCLKVFGPDGTCPVSRVNDAFDHVAETCVDPLKCVVNFSGQASQIRSLENAVGRLLGRGITLVTASGNAPSSYIVVVPNDPLFMDSCEWDPSGVKGVVSVGATDAYGRVAVWSKIGRCVSVFAPGDGIPIGRGITVYGTSFSCAVETARRAQCASVGDATCGGPYASVSSFNAAVVNKFPALVNATTRRWILLR